MSDKKAMGPADLLEGAGAHFLDMRRRDGASAELARHELLAVVQRTLLAATQQPPPDGAAADALAPIHPDALTGIAGRFVRLLEPHTESDAPSLLVQFLTAFGNSIGRGAHARAEDDRHYGNLFSLVVGGTSRGRKGTSWSRVRAFVAAADKHWAETCIHPGGLSSGEGLIWAVRDAADDGTAPGVAEKRQLVVQNEFTSVLRVCARDGNTLSQTLRSAWDTGELAIKTKAHPCRVTGAHTSVIAHVTRQELLRRMDLADVFGGLFNRFLIVCTQRSKLLPEGSQPPAAALDALAIELRKAFEFGREHREIGFDADARSLWREVYPVLSTDRPGLYGAGTARAEAQVLRVALVYAVLDCSPHIRVSHLRAALALWDYCDRSAEYVLGGSQGDAVSDDVLVAVRGHGDWMTRTEIVNALNRHASGARLQRAIDALRASGMLDQRDEPSDGGRPRQLFRARKASKANVLELCSLSSQLYRIGVPVSEAPSAAVTTPEVVSGVPCGCSTELVEVASG